MSKQINVCICGVHGYVGRELIKLVVKHPSLHLVGVLGREADPKSYQEISVIAEQTISVFSVADINEKLAKIDVLLLATPPEVSIELVSVLKNNQLKIIDLSGAFRLPMAEFKQWYNLEHQLPELLTAVHYGLSPWNNDQKHTLVANPGCYATCALMALIPLLKQDIINSSNIIIDAKSGVSGAGKKANQDLMYCEMTQNFYPYKIGKHQHIPEINNGLAKFANESCNVTLVTHMLPISRGISMSIYADANNQFNSDANSDANSDEVIAAAIEAAYATAYENYSLIKFGEINKGDPENDKFLLALKNVVGTPKTHIAYYVNNGKVFIFACIDNLLKGAASQAIENINASYHLPLETGLLKKESVL